MVMLRNSLQQVLRDPIRVAGPADQIIDLRHYAVWAIRLHANALDPAEPDLRARADGIAEGKARGDGHVVCPIFRVGAPHAKLLVQSMSRSRPVNSLADILPPVTKHFHSLSALCRQV